MAVTFDAELVINAPPERVYDLALDPDRFGEWMDNFVRVEVLDAGGPDRVGARWRETRKMFGKEATEEFEVTEGARPERYALYVDGSKGTTGKGEYRFTYDLAPAGDGTRMRFTGEIEAPGFFGRVMSRLMVGAMRKMCLRDMQRFAEFARRAGR